MKITIAVKSCFAGLSSDGFDFIRGLDLGLHLNEVKISSLLCNDFIKLTKNEPGAIPSSFANNLISNFCLNLWIRFNAYVSILLLAEDNHNYAKHIIAHSLPQGNHSLV